MRKTLIALAISAVGAPALAQSSVTIYGRVDVAVQKTPGNSARMDASNGTNRLGFMGTEDLGGGLKATFKIESRFSPESGSNDGANGTRPFWQGETTVGLAGAWGSVRLGRSLTAYHLVDVLADPWTTERVASLAPNDLKADTSGVADGGYSDGGGMARSDGIHYLTNDYNGFKGAISFGPKSQSAAITGQQRLANVITTGAPGAAYTAGAKNLISGSAWYASGPVYIGLGYEQNRRDENGVALTGSYDFGLVKVLAGYFRKDTAIAGPDYKAQSLAAVVPFGAFTLKGGYISAKAEGTGAKSNATGNLSKFGLGLDYALSKRTNIYTAYGKPKAVSSSYEFGLSHSF